MALIRQTAADLLKEANAGRLPELLATQARFHLEHRVGTSEIRSWERSLPPFLNDLVGAELGAVEVLLEHKLPHSPKRVDAVLCGVHPSTGEPSYVLVELKQWTSVETALAELVYLPGYSQPRLHPAEQVRQYCRYLIDSTPALADRERSVHGIAYLHNASSPGVRALSDYQPTEFGWLYTMDEKGAMVDHLRSVLDTAGDRAAIRRSADGFLAARHAPTKPLLEMAATEIQKRQQFVLLDEQKVAFKTVELSIERSRTSVTQTVVVVLGGPGSGKSVIALSLLGELARRGTTVHHATGSSAFTRTMRKVAGHRNTRTQTLFKYFNNYLDAAPYELDVLLCDEAHRIREQSVNRYTKRELRERADRQINELLRVARVPVFLLDENQVVRPGEMGSLSEITAAAEARGCRVETIRLEDQFRCGGSAAFDSWVASLLGIGDHAPRKWSEVATSPDEEFVVATAPSPEAVEGWLLQMSAQRGGTARVAAGYCWPWSDPRTSPEGKRLVDDIDIAGWRRPWNAKPDQRVPDVPESFYWASDERGFGQVGCIYTAQGFEYDWAGVIFGPDFVRRNDEWVARKEKSHDPQVKRADEAEFQELIRNTYKVLLTRGMRGVCVFSTDPETQEFLESVAS